MSIGVEGQVVVIGGARAYPGASFLRRFGAHAMTTGAWAVRVVLFEPFAGPVAKCRQPNPRKCRTRSPNSFCLPQKCKIIFINTPSARKKHLFAWHGGSSNSSSLPSRAEEGRRGQLWAGVRGTVARPTRERRKEGGSKTSSGRSYLGQHTLHSPTTHICRLVEVRGHHEQRSRDAKPHQWPPVLCGPTRLLLLLYSRP